MALRDDIEAIHADDALDDAQKRAAVYRIKTQALVDVIRERLLSLPYTHNGARTIIREVMAGPQDQLILGLLVNGIKHTVYIVNPPLLPRSPTGDERADMLVAVREMLEGLGA